MIIQTQAKFVFALLKLMLNFFSGKPKLPLMPKSRGPSTSTKKVFSRFSVWDDELLSTPKVATFHWLHQISNS